MDFSRNWKRPLAEVNTLMMLLKRYIRLEIGALNKNNIRFRVIGRTDDLAAHVQRELVLGIRQTEKNTGMLFNIALNYGGRAEIVDAARRAIAAGIPPEALDERQFGALVQHDEQGGVEGMAMKMHRFDRGVDDAGDQGREHALDPDLLVRRTAEKEGVAPFQQQARLDFAAARR